MGANHIVRSQNDIRDLEGQIARLNKIGIALSAEHDLNRLLNMIVREARHFTNSDGGSLYIREETSSILLSHKQNRLKV